MQNRVSKRIAVSEEILSVLPKNNQTNINKFIKEANKIYATYNKVLLQIEAEAKQRNKIISDSIKDEIVKIKDVSIYPLELKMINPITTPYEKLKLDRYLYYLNPEYECELVDINKYIIEIIKIFNKVGINLTINDFTYGEPENNFINSLLDYKNYNEDKSQEIFASNYWKSPNIISNIQLNFKSLYYKNEKIFNKYFAEYKQDVIFQDLLKEYRRIILENELTEENSANKYLEKFLYKELLLTDYEDQNINSLKDSLFPVGKDISLYTIDGLNKVLLEYKIYKKFEPIIKQVAKDYLSIGKTKNGKAKKIKEILKVDRKITRNNKRRAENLEKLTVLYKEYDELYYLNILQNNLTPHSRISDVIYILISYYKFYYQLNRKLNPEYSQDELKADYHVLYNFYINPQSNLINNLNMDTKEDVAEIILEKYQLNNLKITMSDLEIKELDKLIEKTTIIANRGKIDRLKKINFQTIKEYYERTELLRQSKRKSSQKE